MAREGFEFYFGKRFLDDFLNDNKL